MRKSSHSSSEWNNWTAMSLRERAFFSSLLKAIWALRWFCYTIIYNWLKKRQTGNKKRETNIASNRVEKQCWAFSHVWTKPVLQQIRLLQDAERCYRKWRVVLRVWPRWLNIHLVYFVSSCVYVFKKKNLVSIWLSWPHSSSITERKYIRNHFLFAFADIRDSRNY